ncbi:unnamed protein product, partial [Scytosiphon promiscuus]
GDGGTCLCRRVFAERVDHRFRRKGREAQVILLAPMFFDVHALFTTWRCHHRYSAGACLLSVPTRTSRPVCWEWLPFFLRRVGGVCVNRSAEGAFKRVSKLR